MTDYISFPPPNSLGEAFSESGITGGGGGGGAVSTYTLSQSLNQVVLTPNGGGAVSQVDISAYPAVLALTTKTQNISFASASTIISNNVAVPGNLILDNNTLTTTGTGGTAVLNINGVAVGGGNTANWANFPAVSNVSIPQGTGITIRDNLNFGTGVLGGYYPDATFYPDVFQVGGGTALIPNPINCATNISLYSGVGGTSIASLQGVGILGGVDVDITAGGELALTAATNINLLAPTITVEGIFNVTGENNTIGNTSVEGGFEVVGATTLGGAVNITGETTIIGITTITGGTSISGVASLNGGAAVVGGLGVAGTTSLTGNLTQVGGSITTNGSISGNRINTSTITDNGAGSITIRPSSRLELVNLSSINGSPYIPGTNTPWYSITALSDVNMGGYDINNVRTLQAPVGVGNSNMLVISPSGGISVACPQTLALTGNAGVVLQSDIKATANCVFQVNQNLALQGSTITGVSTINGQPYGGSASDWATFPATTAVNFAGNSLNGVRNINANSGTNLSIVNALTTTNIQGGSQLNLNAVANGANVVVSAGTGGIVNIQSPLSVSTITNVSSINGSVYPPPASQPWYNVPALANVNMTNFDITNIGNIKGQNGGDIFITNQGSGASVNISTQDMYLTANLATGTAVLTGSVAVIGGRTGVSVVSDSNISLQAPIINISSMLNVNNISTSTFNNIPNVSYNTMGSPLWVIQYNGGPNTYTNDQGIGNSQSYLTLATIAGGNYYLYENYKASNLQQTIVLTNPFGDATYLNGFQVPFSGPWRLSMNLGCSYLSYYVRSIDSGRNNVLLLTNMSDQRVVGSIADSPTWYVQTNPTVGFHTINPTSGNTISQVYILQAGVNYGWYFCNLETWGSVDYTRISYANTSGTERNLLFNNPNFTFEYCG